MNRLPGVSRLVQVLSYAGTHGVNATARQAARQLRERVYMRESHIWYERQLGVGAPGEASWPDGVRLVAGSVGRLEVLDRFDSVGEKEARRRLDEGAQWWLVEEDAGPLFSCWILRSTAPVTAAPGGRLPLPSDSVVLEDSVTAPAARGRGIAPQAWTAIAGVLAEQGVARMLTKVEVANTASRKAVLKAGFEELAVMDFARTGPRSSTRVRPLGTCGWLVGALTGAAAR